MAIIFFNVPMGELLTTLEEGASCNPSQPTSRNLFYTHRASLVGNLSVSEAMDFL